MVYDIKNEFLYSLSTLEKSNEKFFIIKIPNSIDLKIIIEQSGCDWVNSYKYAIHDSAKKIKSMTNSPVSEEKFRFIYYFFEFVVPDILIILNILPKKTSKILDIGGGIGLFNIFLNQFYQSNIQINIIEVLKLNEIVHLNNKVKKIDKPIYVIDKTEKFLKKNNIKNLNMIETNKINKFLNIKYDMIFSFRSWGFLYDLELYLDYVNKTLSNGGLVITDVKKENKFLEMFKNNFDNVKILYERQEHLKLIGTKIK